MILSDWDIKVYLEKKLLTIDPLFDDTVRENGVDLRFGYRFCRFRGNNTLVDTKAMNVSDVMECLDRDAGSGFVINPYEHVLATTLEWVELPNDLVGLVNLRSSFARAGIYIPPTVIDAGFKGNITIEIIGGPHPVRVYPEQRFLHIVFLRTSSPVFKPYQGKYQGQLNVTPPKPD
ncbi:MAG: dCTP deaminase [Desulfurococcaceae archaeon]